MSIIQVEKRGTNVSVTFNLQTTQEATGLAELLVRQLKGGELHLQLGSEPQLVIDVPQADPSTPRKNRRLRGNKSMDSCACRSQTAARPAVTAHDPACREHVAWRRRERATVIEIAWDYLAT